MSSRKYINFDVEIIYVVIYIILVSLKINRKVSFK